jgi:4-carboxymuconolactone decarboxylase
MTRLTELAPDSLSPEQKRVFDEIARERSGRASGPFGVWLRAPAIAEASNKLALALRTSSRLERRLLELAVLVVTRRWNAHYAWHVHEAHAREAGIAPAIIDAIRARRTPEFAREDERVVHDTVAELVETRALSEPSYERARAALGTEALVELVAGAGLYTMIAMTLNTFEVPARGGGRLP